MPSGDCFRCHQPGHWANNCPNKTPTKPTVAAVDFPASPPVIRCPCDAGACDVLTSKTEKNPNRKFYKCPAIPGCRFFKWCDEVSIIKSKSLSVLPTCPCGSGPCRKETFIHGPNAQRSCFVCCIKKGFGACGFFQWEDEFQIEPQSQELGNDSSPCHTLTSLLHKADLDSDANVKKSGLGVVAESELSPASSNESTFGNKVVDGIVESVKGYAATPKKESSSVYSSFNNRKPIANDGFTTSAGGRDKDSVLMSQVSRKIKRSCCIYVFLIIFFLGIAPSFDLITVDEDVVPLEAEEQVLLPSQHFDHHPTNGRLFEFKGSSSFMDLVEKFNSEKLHFESVSVKHVDALTAFTSSSKKLESVRDREYSLRKELTEVEKQVKLYEAETSVLAARLEEVCVEMTKSQKKMAEMAVEVSKEVRVNKQMDIVEAQ